MNLTLDTKIQRLPLNSVVDALNENEFVLMDMETSYTCGLNNVAKDIWQLIENPITLRELIDQIKRIYNCTNEVFKEETASFISELYSKNIVKII